MHLAQRQEYGGSLGNADTPTNIHKQMYVPTVRKAGSVFESTNRECWMVMGKHMQTSPSDLLRYQSTKTTQPLKDSLECSISAESTESTPFVHEAAIAFSNFLKQDGETVSQTKKCRSQEKTENMLMRSQA